jgi:hypothetical protein
MLSKTELNRLVLSSPADITQVRIPGLSKPFEQLTISELVQLRPGSQVADTWEVNAVTDNISATTSAALAALGQIAKERAVTQIINAVGTGPIATNEPAPGDVVLGATGVLRTGGE